MKKSILLLALCLTFTSALAQDTTSTMPSDEEILQTIRQYNVDSSQEQAILKATKQQLQEMIKNGGSEYLPEVNKSEDDSNIQEPSVDSTTRVKKYSNHDPLTKHDPLTRRSKE